MRCKQYTYDLCQLRKIYMFYLNFVVEGGRKWESESIFVL